MSTYRRHWLGTLPLPPGEKFPPPSGFTGTNGRWPTDGDVERWCTTTASNIALRLPDTVIGLDVDAYDVKTGDKTLAELTERFGSLPPTWRSTSRNSAATGIFLYRVPKGVRLPGEAGPYIEVIQHHHRYAVVWPSIVGGRLYRLYRPDGSQAISEVPAPDELPELPEAWIAGLKSEATSASRSSSQKPREEMVEGDGRNNNLTSLAGAARRKGAAPASIKALLRAENERFVDPLPDQEVERIASSIGKKTPAAPSFNQTDAGNAELFTSLFGPRLRYDHRRGRLLLWDGVRWAPDADGEINRLALEAARHRFLTAADIPDKKLRAAEASWAIRSEAKQRLDAAINLARSMHPIADAGDGWDAQPWLLGVVNGVVDLRTGLLRDGRQDDKITMQTRVPYHPDATCPRWEQHLEEVLDHNAELVSYVRRYVGYTITGKTSDESLILALGTGRNGKTKTLNALREMLGDYGFEAPFSTFTASRYGDAGATNDLARLDGARMVTAVEPAEGSAFAESRIKALTGGDSVTARFLYHEFFTYRPQCKAWLGMNLKPNVRDLSGGFWSRVRLVLFPVDFRATGREDPGLPDKLEAEYAGILAWAVRACLEWQRDGLKPPASVLAAVEEYRAESDPLTEFIEECCIEDGTGWATRWAVRQAYEDFADLRKLNGKERLTSRGLVKAMEARFKPGKAHGGVRGYHGVRIIEQRYPGVVDQRARGSTTASPEADRESSETTLPGLADDY